MTPWLDDELPRPIIRPSFPVSYMAWLDYAARQQNAASEPYRVARERRLRRRARLYEYGSALLAAIAAVAVVVAL